MPCSLMRCALHSLRSPLCRDASVRRVVEVAADDAASGTRVGEELRVLRAACGKVRRFALPTAIRKSAPGDGFGKGRNLPWDDT